MIPAAPTSVRRWEASHAIPKSRPSFVKDLPDAGMRSALRKEAADALRSLWEVGYSGYNGFIV
jgi:hypothetical protein